MVSEVVEARQRLREAGIRACYFLQFGYPGETWNDIQQTIALVRTTRPDDIGVSVSYPLPNTRFYEKVQAELGHKRNWTDSDDLCVMFTAEYKDAFYHALRDALHAEVDSWRGPAICADAGREAMAARRRPRAASAEIPAPLPSLRRKRNRQVPTSRSFCPCANCLLATRGGLMPDLLLTHGYFMFDDPKELQILKPYAPLGILYLCSHLRAKGFDVDVFDTTFSTRDLLFHHLRTEKPTVLGVYANLMTRRNVDRHSAGRTRGGLANGGGRP